MSLSMGRSGVDVEFVAKPERSTWQHHNQATFLKCSRETSSISTKNLDVPTEISLTPKHNQGRMIHQGTSQITTGRFLPASHPSGASRVQRPLRFAPQLPCHHTVCSVSHQNVEFEDSSSNRLDAQQVRKFASAFGAAVACCTILAVSKPAHAEEREWKPRRHHRRLDERWSNNWAEEVVEEQEKSKEEAQAEKRRYNQLLREQEAAETAARRAEEAARRKKAAEILSKQAESSSNSVVPFSIKIGGREMAPVIVWVGLGLLALGGIKGAVSSSSSRKGKGPGKWVYDRSMGGKKVWVPDEGTTAEDRPLLSDRDLSKLTSIAAAAASASKSDSDNTAGTTSDAPPIWWQPYPRMVPDAPLQAAKAADAERLVRRMEADRNRGQDFQMSEIVKLREICQEGGVSVTLRTVGARDALYRTAVDAAVAVSTDPSDPANNSDAMLVLSEQPTRFLASLARDIEMPAEKAVSMTNAAVAASARARLLDALAGIKEDMAVTNLDPASRQGETSAVLSLLKLVGLFEKLPVLGEDSTEVILIAESLQRTFTVEERQRAFELMNRLYPEVSVLAACLLGFDPNAVLQQQQ